MTTLLESHRPTANGQKPKGSTPDLTAEEFEKTKQIQEAIASSTSNTLEEEAGFSLFEQANIANFRFALWLRERQKSMKPKEFRDLLQREGFLRREANKFLKLAENAKSFASEPEDLAHLGPMMFSLSTPRYRPLWEALQDEGTLTQDVVDALKKQLFPRKTASKSEPESIWRQQPGGGKRYAQLPPIHNQETGTKFQRIMENEGITAQKAFDEVVNGYFDQTYPKTFEADIVATTILPSSSLHSVVLSPENSSPISEVARSLESNSEFQVFTPVPETQPDTSLPSPAAEQPTEYEIAQAELHEYLEAQSQSIAPEPQQDLSPLPSSTDHDAVEVGDDLHWSDEQLPAVVTALPQAEEEITPEQVVTQPYSTGVVSNLPVTDENVSVTVNEPSPCFSSPAPPTERYLLGWNPGDQVIANSVVPTFERWCQGKPVIIESVQGKVGEIQQLNVTRHDGKNRMSFGNWVEELKSQSTASPSPALPTAPQQTLYLVGRTENDWEGEIVQLITEGPVCHRVSRLNSKAWIDVKHAYLQEISFENAVAAQAALSEKIFADYGLRLGDTIQWNVEDVTLTGAIARLTKLGAFIDEGQPGQAWIKYHRIHKVQPSEPVASLDPETRSQATNGAAVASVEVNYALLSDALKKAANWQEVEQLVDRDNSRLTKAVKEWTPVQKNSLRDLLTSYIESDADALIRHQVDWLPVSSLEKSFKQLFFKVKNVMEGLTAPWLNGFEFVHVDSFGKDSEEWTFREPASSQNIKVYDRKDFAVLAF